MRAFSRCWVFAAVLVWPGNNALAAGKRRGLAVTLGENPKISR